MQKDHPEFTKALKTARAYARAGDEVWMQVWFERAVSLGQVNDLQVARLQKLLQRAKERSQQ